MITSGIHHVTCITRDAQANVDFYVGFLGLRLVKRSGGFEDAQQLHLAYGDAVGSPGSLVTFLVWQDGSQGRVGVGQVSEFSLSVPRGSIGFWIARAIQFGMPVGVPDRVFGEPVLRLRDPDGIAFSLVGTDHLSQGPAPVSPGIGGQEAIAGIRGVTLLSQDAQATLGFLENAFGFRPAGEAGSTSRLRSGGGDVVDVRQADGFWTGLPGTGTIDHVAFRATDRQETESLGALFPDRIINSHDRKYFYSLYLREPGGILLESATDKPGMTIDEPQETLGTKLFVPGLGTDAGAATAVMLPQFSLPGQPRNRHLDLHFVHRLVVPDKPGDISLVLLHGSGGNETDLLPLGRRMAPNAVCIPVRGRAAEDGTSRWFRRLTPTTFDEDDIRREAEAFVAFLSMAVQGYGLNAEKLVVVGYSNGANFALSTMLLHPLAIRRAILFRSSLVTAPAPGSDLRGTRVALVEGENDLVANSWLSPKATVSTLGADLAVFSVQSDHNLGESDIAAGRSALGHVLQ